MKKRSSRKLRQQPERTWGEILCFACTCLQLSWRRVVLRKWLNISAADSEFSADSESDSDSETEFFEWPRRSRLENELVGVQVHASDALPIIKRRKSETLRAQYINTKEIRICAATWNVGGRVPPEDLDLNGWLDIDDPADIYVIGLQEIIPLNAGNIFGAEDSGPVSIWESIIRRTLSRVPPVTKFKSFTDPPSPSKFKPSEDAPDRVDDIVLESDSDNEEDIYILNEESNIFEENNGGLTKPKNHAAHPQVFNDFNQEFQGHYSYAKKLDKINCFRTENSGEAAEATSTQKINKIIRTLSGTERIGLAWPEPPLHLLPHHVLERPTLLKSSKSFCGSLKSRKVHDSGVLSDLVSLAELDLESIINHKRRPPYVRIVSKQMVGILITIWVRRGLRRHIQNLNVSTVGVGAMGYLGNKGSISVSMSVHQTLFCFVCTHLTSGEKEADSIKRNADVYEIHKRTQFNSLAGIQLPKSIYAHERIIWLGDLNYRINLPYEQTRELISKKEWSILAEFDQDPGPGRRTPAWCDRILTFGSGMKLSSYRRSELKLSDHRPVTASYTVEVEVFSPRKLQHALTFTHAEIEAQGIVT
ncbi:type IV inositol polyphosphate 5-phosphatase 3-like isoform X2 [Andrographis paniculata]|uniref:type IV inositol polyphosphate 5-phosphatase 3-like isoform X2 n=1 Tax=Andrographis paniculata TaxID=175694 RepID=UPI0021E72E98|nr:type IV inositol polyphosphate 5-phosphatase 3-like isoform X2 [Andrographis paniculata]